MHIELLNAARVALKALEPGYEIDGNRWEPAYEQLKSAVDRYAEKL